MKLAIIINVPWLFIRHQTHKLISNGSVTLFAPKVGSDTCDESLLGTVFVGLAGKRVIQNEI